MKSLIKTTLIILAFLIPVYANAQAVDLDSFLKQVLTKYQKITREKDILALENQMVNSGEAATVNIRNNYDRNNQPYSNINNFKTDYAIENETMLNYSQKFKFGPKINLKAEQEHQKLYGTQNYYYNPTQKDTSMVKSLISLEITQSLYKGLLKEFYITEANDQYFVSREQMAIAREQFVLFKAVTAYTQHQSILEGVKLAKETSRQMTETITFLESTPSNLAKKLKIQQLKNSVNKINRRHLSVENELLKSKYYLCTLIGEKIDRAGLDFVDNSLNRSSVMQKYTYYINDIYKSELAVRESEIKLQEIKIKEADNVTAIDPYIGGRYSLTDQQPTMEKAWEFHSRPNYRIEAGLNFTPYSPQNNYQVEIEQVKLKELQSKYEETIKERNNKLNLNALQVSVQDKKLKIIENEISTLTENTKLQQEYLAQILTSGELTANDTYTEIGRYTTLLNDLENAKLSAYSENLSWIEDIYNNISTIGGYARYLSGNDYYRYRNNNYYENY